MVEFEIAEDGRPLACRADRPRGVGKDTGTSPWIATGSEFREQEGMRVATHIEAAWQLPEGLFTYVRGEVTSFTFSALMLPMRSIEGCQSVRAPRRAAISVMTSCPRCHEGHVLYGWSAMRK